MDKLDNFKLNQNGLDDDDNPLIDLHPPTPKKDNKRRLSFGLPGRNPKPELVHNDPDFVDIENLKDIIEKSKVDLEILIHDRDDLEVLNEVREAIKKGEMPNIDIAILEKSSRPVARLSKGVLGIGGTATGFLIKPDLLITNWHVFFDKKQDKNDWDSKKKMAKATNRARNTDAQFGYREVDRLFDGKKPYEPYDLDPDRCFIANKDLDYCIVGVSGNPGKQWGFINLPMDPPKIPKRVIIIQHPDGEPKQIVLTDNKVVPIRDKEYEYIKTRIRYHADTLPGSSGSPVFDEKFNLIALHRAGKTKLEENEGVLIEAIVKDIHNSHPNIF